MLYVISLILGTEGEEISGIQHFICMHCCGRIFVLEIV
jgi:hypothetical protein